MNSPSNRVSLNPIYPHAPIHGLSALSKALGIHQDVLIKYAKRADRLYRLAKQEKKKDGSIRQTFDAYPVLKAIQVRIQQRILKQIIYPAYLQGSLRGCSPRTNAAIHVNAKIAFAEDIANFFPSARDTLIKNIWTGFMGFSDDVAEVLTMLTTKDSGLPQGAVTSSFLANLVFWSYEPGLVSKLDARGLRYSRYVDDVSVSSKRRLQVEEQTRLVGEIYGMLLHHGFQPKRSKHELFTAGKSMRTTKLLSNKRVALPVEQRQNIRAAVYALEKRIASGDFSGEVAKELARVASRVGRLGSFHSNEGTALKKRLRIVRQTLELVPVNVVAQEAPALACSAATINPNSSPPWD
jgi:hypothetical protein